MSAHEPLNYGHYHVHRRPDGGPWVLGVGGMGVTYKAVDTRLHVDVALKVIHPARIADPDAQKLFIREARAAAKVYHPNVSPVVFLNDEPGRVFYAMEYVDGISLYVWLRKHGPPSLGQALAFAEQIAAGLGAIHEQQLVHRDLKPANIMVVQFPAEHPRHRALTTSGGCHLKIIDFGLARGTGDTSGTPDPAGPMPTLGFRGTAGYASPEQCEEDSDIDGRSDLYALGCILWELLRGRPPFVGKTHRELLNQQVAAPPPWADLGGIPESVIEILRCLLAKRREDRFPDAATLGDALAQARRGLGPAGAPAAVGPRESATAPASTILTPTPPSGGTPPPTARSTQITLQLPARWWLGALLLCGLLGALAIWMVASRPADPKLRPLANAVPTDSLAPEAAERRRFIAVLPFANLTGEKENEYFADGVHDDILTSLAKLRELRVISRASVMKYRGKEINLKEVARTLGVGTVLEGSVRRSGKWVRVTTQLIDAETDQHLWAETYDRELTDIFQIQSAVAKEIASSLAMNLSPGEQRAIARQPTKNKEAAALYAQARSQFSRSPITRISHNQVIELLEKAVKLDPEFAHAYAMAARVHGEIFWFGIDESPERIARARAVAQKAAEIQFDLPEARVALGEIMYRFDRNFEGALREYRNALRTEPNNPIALESAALALRRLNQWAESTVLLTKAAALSPDDGQKQLGLAEQLFVTRRYAEALPYYKRAVELSKSPTWQIHQEYCQYELDGDWEGFVAKAKRLMPAIHVDSRRGHLAFIGDLAGALQLAENAGTDEVAAATSPVPKKLAIGLLLFQLGRVQEARALCAEAAEVLTAKVVAEPKRAELRMKRALALAGALDRDAAIMEAEQAARELPESADAIAGRHLQMELAQVYAMLGDAEKACAILERLVTVELKFTRRMAARMPEYAVLRGYPRFERLIAGG